MVIIISYQLCESISLHDLLHLVPSNKDKNIVGTPPNDESNLAYKAAEKLLEYTGIKKGVEIRIKGYSCCRGFGGSFSADAAGVLLGLNKLWDLGIHLEDLSSLGMGLGLMCHSVYTVGRPLPEV